MKKAVICEDEVQTLQFIQRKLNIFFQNAGLSFQFQSFDNPLLLKDTLGKGQLFDLYFLDIEMPEMDGLSLAKKIRTLNPDAIIVFISNKDELVFQSFEVRPFRFIRKNHFEEELPGLINALKKALSPQKNPSLVLKNGSEIITISISDLIYVEAMRKECLFHTTSEIITLKYKLSDISKELTPYGFIQSHRSFLINYRYIFSISRDGISLDNKEVVPIGRTHLEQVKKEFQHYIQEM
ncbi:MAG: LytTR family DNA-binding domain-containing protein [Lachnospiraceae bacterium]|nr:LytTR family DNA-binding domain-containing protein [Lachnospiraceae bacterium]